ncbi:VTC domain-containing protein [Flavobacteriaceae bacterium]|nr:VTC domain-containing protein [Flavobacteriaceae bacterium]
MKRYEHKFAIKSFKKYLNFRATVLSSFSKTFDKRKINNIYFDSDHSSSLFENLDGNYTKVKIRIRWYDDSKKYYLELKGKKGSVGFKKTEEVFIKNPELNFKKLKVKRLSQILIKVPENFKLYENFKAVSFNSYIREYYSNKKNNIRLTIDSSLSFINLRIGTNLYTKNFKIIEFKYKAVSSLEAAYSKLVRKMPEDISKFSKFSNSTHINSYY